MKPLLLAALTSLFVSSAFATTPVLILPTKTLLQNTHLNVESLVRQNIDLSGFDKARVQVISRNQKADHLLVHLHVKGIHRVEFAALYLDNNGLIVKIERNYNLTARDEAEQPGAGEPAVCPDPSIQFIAFAPNSNDLELQVTKDVAAAALAKGLKTIQLLEANATRAAYLNYMACPKLVGNFYDGDSNPTEFITVDGLITSDDMKTVKFNHKVTNIWLACEAYNDPMLSAVTIDAAAQKYAAGVNDLQVGPSDNAGKCAMIAGINGQAMTAAFAACYKQYDNPDDQWGFGGNGSDFFGQ